jgi:hypothetical protein
MPCMCISLYRAAWADRGAWQKHVSCDIPGSWRLALHRRPRETCGELPRGDPSQTAGRAAQAECPRPLAPAKGVSAAARVEVSWFC